MKSGPIILVEDDADDEDIFEEVLKELKVYNKIVWFTNGKDTIEYLKTTSEQPFIIFSDINLPGLSGIEMKKRIDADKELRRKSIPFVFYSTAADQEMINEAYTKMTVQGFFKKGNSYEETKKMLRAILDYWKFCKHPNTF